MVPYELFYIFSSYSERVILTAHPCNMTKVSPVPFWGSTARTIIHHVIISRRGCSSDGRCISRNDKGTTAAPGTTNKRRKTSGQHAFGFLIEGAETVKKFLDSTSPSRKPSALLPARPGPLYCKSPTRQKSPWGS
jgi:hypothetical protein